MPTYYDKVMSHHYPDAKNSLTPVYDVSETAFSDWEILMDMIFDIYIRSPNFEMYVRMNYYYSINNIFEEVN